VTTKVLSEPLIARSVGVTLDREPMTDVEGARLRIPIHRVFGTGLNLIAAKIT
jgi:hypothetical protein